MSSMQCQNFRTSYHRDDTEAPWDFICDFDKKIKSVNDNIEENWNTNHNLNIAQTKEYNNTMNVSVTKKEEEPLNFLPNHPIATLINLPLNTSMFSVSMVICPSGHMTRDFLSCDLQSGCVTNEKLEYCRINTRTSSSDNGQDFANGIVSETLQADQSNTEDNLESNALEEVWMFACVQSGVTISYTLVCDFEQHCYDGSDEYFCVFDPCLDSGKLF